MIRSSSLQHASPIKRFALKTVGTPARRWVLASLTIFGMSLIIGLNWPATPQPTTTPPSGWTVAPPLFINGNNWTSPYVSGSGTDADPYVIRDISINGEESDYCIWIKDTRAVFRIVNCILTNASSGVTLQNTSNGQVTNNTCNLHTHNGISLESSDNNTVANNICNSDDPTRHCTSSSLGIYLNNSNSNTVANNTCNSDRYGIYLDHSNQNTVTNNTCISDTPTLRCASTTHGIFLDYSNSNRVTNNTCNSNSLGCGIYIFFAGNNTVANNTCNLNDYGIYLQSAPNTHLSQNMLTGCNFHIEGNLANLAALSISPDNTVNGRSVYFFVNETNLLLPISNPGQAILVNCTSTVVTTASSAGCTIQLFYSTNNTICGFNCTGGESGISLRLSHNNTLVDTTCSSNSFGIYIEQSHNNTVINTRCTSNGHGILIEKSHNSTVTNTTCTANYYGIFLSSSNSSTITNNSCNSNGGSGISLSSSNSSTITNNSCNSNGGGDGIELFQSNNNTISQNTCAWNYRGIVLEFQSSFNNITFNIFKKNYGSPIVNAGAFNAFDGNSVILKLVATYTRSIMGLSVVFNASSSTGGVTPYAYSWDFGDGATATGETPAHVYSRAGAYRVTFTVMDAEGDTEIYWNIINVCSADQVDQGDTLNYAEWIVIIIGLVFGVGIIAVGAIAFYKQRVGQRIE